MHTRILAAIVLIISLPTLAMFNPPPATQTAEETINLDGDLNLSPEQNQIYWNPHAVGITDPATWKITLDQQAEIRLQTTENQTGHVATGAWWTTAFKTKQKTQLYSNKPTQLTATFKINLVSISLETGNEWLRIALATAVQRTDGTITYTEIDLWDSPKALNHPTGNINQNGNTVYRGGNVIEYKTDQLPLNTWRTRRIDITAYINTAWKLQRGDVLESVYFVAEAEGAVNATVLADDLQITRPDPNGMAENAPDNNKLLATNTALSTTSPSLSLVIPLLLLKKVTGTSTATKRYHSATSTISQTSST